MIKTLRKLQGKRTHIALVASTVGTAVAATGLGVDPQALVLAATGSVDAINGVVQTVDNVKAIDWQQVSSGMMITLVGNLLGHYFREIGKRK